LYTKVGPVRLSHRSQNYVYIFSMVSSGLTPLLFYHGVSVCRPAKGVIGKMKNTQQRRAEKRDRLLLWLGAFRLTTFSLWCEYEGLVMRGQYQFKKALLDERLIGVMPYAGSQEEILILTPKGKGRVLRLNPDLQTAVTNSAAITTSHIPHTLLVQQSLMAFHDKSKTFRVEPCLDRTKSVIRPDALIWYDGQYTALEMENSPKYKLRVYQLFRFHIKMLVKKHYAHVLYSFNNATTLNFYQNLFEASIWPVVVFASEERRYRIKKNDEGQELFFDPGHYRRQFSLRMM
jgi:hypothetical protein